jgi:single-strand DNA-binding protein
MKFSNNEVTLTGFVGKDAESKQTQNLTSYAVVNLATSERWKDQNDEWQKRTTWHRLVGYGRTGEAMQKLTKGTFVQVRGKIRNYELPAKDGLSARRVSEVVLTAFAKLDRAAKAENSFSEVAA